MTEETSTEKLQKQIKAKDKWINKLLIACEYLAEECTKINDFVLPKFVIDALEYPETEFLP